jgi:hypothetical protein
MHKNLSRLFILPILFFCTHSMAEEKDIIQSNIVMHPFINSILMEPGALHKFDERSLRSDSSPHAHEFRNYSSQQYHPRVFRGEVINATDYPALMWYIVQRSNDPNKIYRCSASQIGPRVILTAAHCFKKQIKAGYRHISIKFKPHPQDTPMIDAVCTTHGDFNYARNHQPFPDFSLCLLSQVRDTMHETISFNPVVRDQEVFIYGYGCFVIEDRNNRNNALSRAKVKVINPVPGIKNYSIRMNDSRASLCNGDSGGPTMVNTENKRTVVAVNTKGNYDGDSQSSGLSSEQFRSFLQSWSAENNNPVVCGSVPSETRC